MCNMGEQSFRLPLHLTILLFICVCGLVGHIMSDSPGANNHPAIFDPAQHGGHVYADEGCDQDDLVFPSIAHWSAEYVSVPAVAVRTGRPSYFPISPLQHPPNS